jgi:6-phosphogluconate dehydrogenase
VSNRSPGKVDDTVARAKDEGNLPLTGHKDPKDFIAVSAGGPVSSANLTSHPRHPSSIQSLVKPRKVIILVQAGAAVDSTIALLSESMEAGDIIVDGGNEWFPNSQRRAKELEPKGIMFVGMGVSGGEEGARKGPSLMPGGPKEAFDILEPIITKAAAQVDDGPCTTYLGGIGSGNYVKMVHNGIEYGDMQLIAEAYGVLKEVAGMDNEELAATFVDWNSTELESFLIEITGKILAKKDDLTSEGYVVDKILDKTGMKGTGRWTIQEAAEQSVAAPTMAAALDARYLSARKDERVAASAVLEGPAQFPKVLKKQLIADVQAALYCSKICSYAQGMCLIKAASEKNGWGIDLGECARIWKGGCIIRAGFLNNIKAAYVRNPNLANLLVDPEFAASITMRQNAWRRVVSLCVASGIPCPSMCSSLTYFDTYRRANLTANLVQAQRDFFGGHTYERIDREGAYHCLWDDSHKDIGDLSGRRAGEL